VGKVLGYTSVVLGVGLLAGAGVTGAMWINDSNRSSQDRSQIPSSIKDVCTTTTSAQAEDACKLSQDAKTLSTAGWAMGIGGAVLGVTGLVLLATDHSSKESSKENRDGAGIHDLEVLPAIGTRGAAVDLRWSF
jgi:hypothetical protein